MIVASQGFPAALSSPALFAYNSLIVFLVTQDITYKGEKVKFNKVYIPVDALSRHEDFDTWYEDGDLFLHFECKKGWKSEKDRVQIIGRMGGQVGEIKPDNYGLVYFIRYERYEYKLHTYVIGHHYYVEGMVWDLYGSFNEPPFNLVEETLTSYNRKSVRVRRVEKFRNHGACLEVHVPELEKLRIAVASIVAIGLKEEWKGKSEGEDREIGSFFQRMKSRIFENKGFTYEEIQKMIAEGHPLVKIIKPIGRPIDNPKSHYAKRREKEMKQQEQQEQNLADAKRTLRAARAKNSQNK